MKNIAVVLPNKSFTYPKMKVVTNEEANPIFFFYDDGAFRNSEKMKGFEFVAVVFHPDLTETEISEFLSLIQYRIR